MRGDREGERRKPKSQIPNPKSERGKADEEVGGGVRIGGKEKGGPCGSPSKSPADIVPPTSCGTRLCDVQCGQSTRPIRDP
jgi:hypothetical protein